MQLYSILDANGNIRLSQIYPNPNITMLPGERMLPDDTPEFDSTYQKCVRVEPVPVDALVVPYQVSYIAIEDARVRAKSALNSERDRREALTFDYMGLAFDCDSRSVQRINTAVQAAQAAQLVAPGQPFEIVWTAADNTPVAMSASDLMGMPIALATHAGGLHYLCRTLKDSVDAAQSVEEILSIAWPA